MQFNGHIFYLHTIAEINLKLVNISVKRKYKVHDLGTAILEDLVRCLHLMSKFKRREKIKTEFIQRSI